MIEEAQIVEGCIKKDQRCRTLLYERYAPSLYAVALRYTKNEEDAQDVLQDAFLRIFDTIKLYDGRGSLLGWLNRIVINETLNFVKLRSKVIFESFDDYEERIADESVVVSDKLTHEILLNIIRELPQGQQAVFNLCVIDEYSYEEAAQMLNCSQSTCRTQLFKAKNLLKEKVNNFFKRENR